MFDQSGRISTVPFADLTLRRNALQLELVTLAQAVSYELLHTGRTLRVNFT